MTTEENKQDRILFLGFKIHSSSKNAILDEELIRGIGDILDRWCTDPDAQGDVSIVLKMKIAGDRVSRITRRINESHEYIFPSSLSFPFHSVALSLKERLKDLNDVNIYSNHPLFVCCCVRNDSV